MFLLCVFLQGAFCVELAHFACFLLPFLGRKKRRQFLLSRYFWLLASPCLLTAYVLRAWTCPRNSGDAGDARGARVSARVAAVRTHHRSRAGEVEVLRLRLGEGAGVLGRRAAGAEGHGA